MRVLGLDVGAKRLGYAIVDSSGDEFTLYDSGCEGVERMEQEPYNEYRQRLIDYWVANGLLFLHHSDPDLIVSELLPAVGSGNFSVATQNQLVLTAVTTLQALNREHKNVEWREIPAATWKKALHGQASKPPKTKGGKRQKISKVDTRNAIQSIFPALAQREWETDLLPDESDAIAVALVGAGYKRT